MIKLVIFGSRSIKDRDLVFEVIARKLVELELTIEDIDEVIVGGAGGIDTLAEDWTRANYLPVSVLNADWTPGGKLDRSAVIKRNIDMAQRAQVGIGIWDGESPGTRHMRDYMDKLRKPCAMWKPPQLELPLPMPAKANPTQGSLFDQFQ
jgi:hypothetical protein